MHPLNIAVLVFYLFVLQQKYLGIVGRDKARLHVVVLLKGHTVENVQRELHQFVAVRGIDGGSRQYAVAHFLYAATGRWEGVDAEIEDGRLLGQGRLRMGRAVAFYGRAGADGHAVVAAKDQTDGEIGILFFEAAQNLFHSVLARLLFPVALLIAHGADAGVRLQGIGKSVVALDGGRRPVFASNLHDLAPSAEKRGGIIAQHSADAIVVGPHIGGVVLHVALAVEENHGDAFVGSMGDG